MTDRTSTRTSLAPNLGVVEVVLASGTTVCGATDTLTCTLADFGITNVLTANGYVHTTDYSVIVAEAGTVAVSAGVLTYTMVDANANKRRVVVIRGN